jgi:phosphatidylinositol-4-phosphate 3-kinase
MSNQQMSEAERQFQADLEKATALSMESLALEEFRRKKRTSIPSPATVKLTHQPEEVGQKSLQEYRNYLKQRTMSLNESTRPNLGATQATPNPIAPPPAVPTRRNSVQTNREDLVDLISFTPASTQQVHEQDSQHATFVQLVDNMHK